MEQIRGELEIYSREISETLTEGMAPMVNVHITYPEVSGGTARGMRRINRFYRSAAQSCLSYAKRTLLPAAVNDYKYRMENGFPFFPYEAVYTYTVTWNEGRCLSLFTELYEYTGGAHGYTTRYGDTWRTSSGWPMEMARFFPKGTHYRKLLTDNAAAIATEQIAEGTGAYFDDYPKLIRKYFRSRNFYITKEGLALFYALYTIAPYSSGIPVFIYENCLQICTE